jgi:hypothetical protein
MLITMSESEGAIILEAIAEAKKITENDNTTLALEMICQDWMTDRGAIPEKTPLSHHVKYLEEQYGVKITYTAPEKAKREELKAAAEKQKKTAKVVEKAEKVTAERKKTAEKAPSPSAAPEKKTKSVEKESGPTGGDVDINAILGMTK